MYRSWTIYRSAYFVRCCTKHLKLCYKNYHTHLILCNNGVNTVNYHTLEHFKQEMAHFCSY
uniref:Uncharacterized protein n=1 Tax=Arundo donax TaxID=35708 RepID=A0A0A9G4K4_ARUDO